MTAMTPSVGLFDLLTKDFDRLSHRRTLRRVASWRTRCPQLACCETAADVVAWCSDRRLAPTVRRAVLGELVEIAGSDRLATEVVFAVLVPKLRVVAAELTGRWRAEREVVDQEVAAGAWARLMLISGSCPEWPDTMIVTAARTAARDRLQAEARRAAKFDLGRALGEPAVEVVSCWDAAELVAGAVRRGVVSPDSARLVWATRVLGVPACEVAAELGDRPGSVVMRRHRAERALREDRATRAAWKEAG